MYLALPVTKYTCRAKPLETSYGITSCENTLLLIKSSGKKSPLEKSTSDSEYLEQVIR